MNIVYFLLALACCFSREAAAQQSEPKSEPKWQFSVALGAGVRTNPVLDNNNIPLFIIPSISYQGERFFIQNVDFGYTLYQTEQQQINLILTPSYDQVFFNRWDINNFVINSNSASVGSNTDGPTKVPGGENLLINVDPVVVDGPGADKNNRAQYFAGLHQRRMAGLAGIEYSIALNNIDVQMQALQEFTQYYKGQELRLALSKHISAGKHRLKFTLGANWQSNDTLMYFYGIDADPTLQNDSLKVSSGVSGLVRMDWNYRINTHWSLQWLASYRRLSDSVIRSPLINDNNVITAFAGGVYHF
jgi:MipA family protein